MLAKSLKSVCVAACLLMSGTVTTHAATYSFACVSGNNPGNCADGQATLSVDVTDPGNNQVDFTFRNVSALGSTITEVYFDDGTLLGILPPLFDSGTGVNFTNMGVSPGNLPAGNQATPSFVTTAGFSADVVQNTADGIDNALDGGAQEFLTIRFNLINGKTFSQTIDSLNGLLTAPGVGGPALRVGLHVRSFSDGGSESFVNAIPEPQTYALMGLGLVMVGMSMRRGRRR